ncbi:MAG: efflux RND transporter periplasmic adaptor subunit [Rhodospirillaceae bacterium]|nr:efflux RND transporter periplasmic adaptor subunit [Rhodospirillaceae bacterium]
MRFGRAIIGLVAVAAVAGGAWFYFSPGKGAATGGNNPAAMRAGGPAGGRAAPPSPVYVATAQEKLFGDRVEAIGTLSANESVVVTSKAQGIVRLLNFTDGQSVAKGDEIAIIDPGEQDAKLDAELANLEEQKRTLERTSGLARSNNTSQAKLDEQLSAVKKAEANVAAARARVRDYRIWAPFTGVLGTRKVSPGALVTPGTVITTLDDVSVVKLDFAIPETFLAALKLGLDIEASSAAYPGEIFKGQVTAVESRVDPTTRSVSIRAVIPNLDKHLRPGMLMVVELIKDRRNSLMIPEQALQPQGTQQFVYVVGADNSATKTEITIGRRRPGSVEVLKGLSAGDRIVTEGAGDLRPGVLVEVLAPKGAPSERPPG